VIVFSDSGCVEASLPGDDASDCVDALMDALVAIGWTYVSSVTGGHKLEATSKQDLQARLTVATDGSTKVKLTMMSADETAVGQTFRLKIAASQTYKVIANECQAFIWLPGYSDEDFAGNWDHNWAAGIPYVMQTEVNLAPIAGECGVIDNDAVMTEDCWWSCGGGGASTTAGATFRWTLTTGRFTGSASWNYNVTAGFGSAHTPRIFPTRHAQVGGIGASHDPTRWADGDPLYLDPYIGWGDTVGGHARFRGQLYDAFLASCDQPLEDEVQTDEPKIGGGDAPVNWINYTHAALTGPLNEGGSYNGSLYLRRGPVVLTGGGKRNYLYHG